MNKKLLLTATAVASLGLASCNDDSSSGSASYTISMDSTTVPQLIAVLSGVDVDELNAVATSVNDQSSTIVSKALSAKASTSETYDCEDGGSSTYVRTQTGQNINASVTYNNCTEYGETRNGSMSISIVENGNLGGTIATTGNFTITGVSAFTSMEYKNFLVKIDTVLDENEDLVSSKTTVSGTLSLVSDSISGTFGMSGTSDSTTSTYISILKGANSTSYVETDKNGSSVCSLNDSVVACY